MYAVIETGGKQYRVKQGDVLDVERGLEVEDGKVEFDRVLMLGGGDDDLSIGTPTVDGAVVRASAVEETRGPKVQVFKFKRRKGYRRKTGHRQNYLRVRIDEIAS